MRRNVAEMSNDWKSLNIREKIMLVTTDILQLLDRVCEKTQPGGELDSVIESASKSFEPLGELLQIKWEEGNKSINVQTLSQLILSGRSIITPEVAQLLGSSFKPAARNAEENEGKKSLSQDSEREQSDDNTKRIDELLHSRDYRRHKDSVFEKVLSKHGPVKDLTQPGPSGLQTRRKDVSIRERLLKQSLRGLSSPTPSGTSSEHRSGAKQPREHSENLSQPGPSGVRAFLKQGAKGPGKNEGNESSSRSSQSEQVNDDDSKRIELQTQLELSDVEAKRKNVSMRGKFTKQSVRGLHQPGPTGASFEEISEVSKERWARQLSKDLSQPGPSRESTPKQTARSQEEREGNKRLSRSQREQTHLGLSDTQTKRKDELGREKFPKNIFRSESQQRPSETSYTSTREERQSRHRSEESSRPGRGERSKGFRKHMLPKHSSVDQTEFIHSKRKKKSSDSKRTRESSSIYKSYTHYNPGEWEEDSDEYENDHRRSSTIY